MDSCIKVRSQGGLWREVDRWPVAGNGTFGHLARATRPLQELKVADGLRRRVVAFGLEDQVEAAAAGGARDIGQLGIGGEFNRMVAMRAADVHDAAPRAPLL